jgi:hypothetical protein
MSTNNASNIYLDLGPNGGRNARVRCVLCELAGQFTGTAGFAQSSQSATNVGYGIEITSSCDNTTAPTIEASQLWQNSYSGISASCPGTIIGPGDYFDNGLASASAQTEAGITINAANVNVVGGFYKKGTAQNYGIYQLSGDTPSVGLPVCDSSISWANCVYAGTQPTNGYQQGIGQAKFLTGTGVPSMACSNGWKYERTDSGTFPTDYSCVNGAWVAEYGALPLNPQVGDTLRYNVNGDNLWDAVNMVAPSIIIYAVNQQSATSTGLGTLGYCGNAVAVATGNTSNSVNPTATLAAGNTIASSASASTNTVIGADYCLNGSVSLLGITAFYRWSYRASIGSTTNARYWHGLATYNSTGIGNNSANIVGSTAYANDTPNKTTIGFRYSSGTDTHWQAVVITAGSSSGAQTTVDTGITPDTNVHLFEFTTNSTGTGICFFIDSALVTSPCITTNIPVASGGGNSWGSLFFTGDNKNTANAVSETFYSMQISLKL